MNAPFSRQPINQSIRQSVRQSIRQSVLKNDPYSRAIRLLRWVVTALGFLWCTRVPAQPPVWQPLWFSDLSADLSVEMTIPLNYLSLNHLNRNPSSIRIQNQYVQRRLSTKKVALSFLITHPDLHKRLEESSYLREGSQKWLSPNPDPEQFTSYETAPLYLHPSFVLTRMLQ
jgi:hypothetical protein